MKIENFPPLLCRYCPNLDHNVVIMQKQKTDGTSEPICLCSHLCEKEKRRFCSHHNEKDRTYHYYY